jgi:hypothetical protein
MKPAMDCIFTDAESGNACTSPSVLPLLESLDQLLARAVLISRSLNKEGSPPDAFRGLYITQEEAEGALQRKPGRPLYAACGEPLFSVPEGSRFHEFQEIYSLEPFDWGVIAIALGPEIDLRYERIYGFLQDDVTRKRPTINLVLDLLCNSTEEKLCHRHRFASSAPLLRQKIVHTFTESAFGTGPFLGHSVRLNDWVIRHLLDEKGFDGRLTEFCRFAESTGHPDESLVAGPNGRALTNLLLSAIAERKPSIIFVRGASGLQSRHMVEAAARECCQRLLVADFSEKAASETDVQQLFEQILYEANAQAAIPYFEGIEQSQQTALARNIEESGGVAMVAGGKGATFPNTDHCTVITLDAGALDFRQRREFWARSLLRNDCEVEGAVLDALAGRFRFTPEQIIHAANEGCARAHAHNYRPLNQGDVLGAREETIDILFAAARNQSGKGFAKVAKKLEPRHGWSDLVLPSEIICQLQEFCTRVKMNEQVFGIWGFESKLSQGKGATALFVGPSGTGKTIAAEVIANEIELDIYKIDLASVVSKYIGETEQNLDRIFTAAEDANVVLFFDEAEALFGKRSEVRDSHDRYANMEVSYLLQKMEAYEGAAILASNLGQHMDEAFLRRFAFTVRFPFPEEDCRRRIWEGIWPKQVPLKSEIDFGYLAVHFRLSGGNIKNVAVAAAFFAAEAGEPVNMSHLFRGIEREYQKMGKSVSAAELSAGLSRAVRL